MIPYIPVLVLEATTAHQKHAKDVIYSAARGDSAGAQHASGDWPQMAKRAEHPLAQRPRVLVPLVGFKRPLITGFWNTKTSSWRYFGC